MRKTKKVLLLLCVIHNMMLFAQTETLVTPNGKKVNFNSVFVNKVDNGLMLKDNTVELGGELNKATTINTTIVNTLSITGLQTNGSTSDNIVVTDPTTGVLKLISTQGITGTEPWHNSTDNSPATANTQNIYQMGNVGIGQNTATTKLDIKSSSDASALKIEDGTQKALNVLTSDANGVGIWSPNELAVKTITGSQPSGTYDLNTGMLIPGAEIVLPTGNWVVFLGVKLNPKIGQQMKPNSPYGGRFVLSTSNIYSWYMVGAATVDGNATTYNMCTTGNNPAPTPVFVTGCMRVNVTDPTVKFYLWNWQGSATCSIGNDPENFFYAMNVQ